MKRTDVVAFLNELLEPEKIEDSTFNGLQVEGKSDISKIAYAVDSSLQSFKAAVNANADMLIVHHGLIWGGLKKIVGMEKKRIKVLLQNELNLYVSHLPLDFHAQVGNNAQLVKLLGLKTDGTRFYYNTGFYSYYEKELDLSDFKERVAKLTHSELTSMDFGPKTVRKVALCSGGIGSDSVFEASALGADTILVGEGSAASLYFHPARELGLNVIFAGHYATETFGLAALQKEVEKNFPEIQNEFLDLPTGW